MVKAFEPDILTSAPIQRDVQNTRLVKAFVEALSVYFPSVPSQRDVKSKGLVNTLDCGNCFSISTSAPSQRDVKRTRLFNMLG